ncbi:MAG: metallophosphoesterase, partial [Bryobacteraceae bacterium]
MPVSRRRLLRAGVVFAAPFLRAVPGRAATLVRSPYLQNQRATRVTIRWTTLEDGDGLVQFSTDRNYNRSVATRAVERTPEETGLNFTYYRHHAVLTGLATDTQYYYRIQVEGQDLDAGEDLEFRTTGAGSFDFLVIGDSGLGTSQQRELARLMERERASLLVHTGDLVYPDGTFEAYERRYFDYYQRLMRRMPFFPTPGNHDYYKTGGMPYVAVHSLPAESVPEADAGRYYSFELGNVHFICLDSNTPLERAARNLGPMLRWLETDLQNARRFWRVAYFHHPPFAGGPNQNDPLSRLVRDHIVPVLERHNVPIAFSGHEHSYQRSYPLRNGQPVDTGAGTVYITSGGGGASLYPVYPNRQTAIGSSSYHYMRAQVTGSRMELRTIRPDGVEIDAFTIAPPPVLSNGAVVNAASLSPEISAGGLVSIRGLQLAASESQALRVPLPRTLGGVVVRFNGRELPLLFTSPTQVNAQLPFDALGPGTLEVTTENGAAGVPVFVAEVAPAIFSVPVEGNVVPAVVHANGQIVTP